jgi:hypothetical protein
LRMNLILFSMILKILRIEFTQEQVLFCR